MIEVILPALDEAEAIPGVIAAMPAGFTALVVDNGSVDATAEVAKRCGARVVSEPKRGFGAACFAGLLAATTDVVCFMDCDGSLDPGELPAVVRPVLNGDADLSLGARVASARGAWPWHARLANRVLAFEVRRRCGVAVTDIGPMRAARREALIELALRDRGFGWPLEMVLRAGGAGWRISETSVSYGPRSGGRSKVSGSARGTFRAVRDMGALLSEGERAAGGPGGGAGAPYSDPASKITPEF